MKRAWTALLCLMSVWAFGKAEISGELKTWHKVTLTFQGPETSEQAQLNPFMNYRLNVTFRHPATGKIYVVPGYFAADGNAAETSAVKGDKWRVHFSPDRTGTWEYEVDFRKGNYAAISSKKDTGKPGEFMDGETGSFDIAETDKTGRDFRSKGRLDYVGGHYLQFAGSGEYFLKMGPDAPENFLSYAEFDGTQNADGHKDNLVKTWEAHSGDWKNGDPVWQGGKGKGIIGALNYLESEGLNSVSFLTMNIGGDDQNAFPYVDYDTLDRFDCSKLDQWEIVFEHAQRHGLFLHFKLMEHENQGLLDGGAVGARTKLYYREIIARFGHHLALNWNVCEESGEWGHLRTPPAETPERLACAERLYLQDPYQHHRVIHNGKWFDDILGPESKYTGPSLQTNQKDFRNVHGNVLKLRNQSAEHGKPWAVACDEPGDASFSLLPDANDSDGVNHYNARKNALWGTLLAGGWGVEWYFGYKVPHSDLTCTDWRSRDGFWDYCRYALAFFNENKIPFWEMENSNALIGNPKNDVNAGFCFSRPEVYVIYVPKAGKAELDLSGVSGDFNVRWFNPRRGGALQHGSVAAVKGGGKADLGNPPSEAEEDWVILVR
ncbi:DUF5060 domain-containing protein [Pontiella agarivorans]|uniref:DUF5060 domain-containing protein n=1 Tax=Pontiella agarivorans TaxID=3038953 RepID=A0ABU5N1I9_9BACT|nr:DUF5060 domain-containing protein [Pontiella agarivorans]MDZ8120325.1 DUF5060 domain-containing protein [Pontiella agarivorans]